MSSIPRLRQMTLPAEPPGWRQLLNEWTRDVRAAINALRTAHNGLVAVAGGADLPVLTVTPLRKRDAQALAWQCVLCDPTGGAMSVVLPDARANRNAQIVVKNTTSSLNTITVIASVRAQIDGAGSEKMTTANASLRLISSGEAWWVI